MCSGYFGLCPATQNGEREHVLRTVLATAGAVLVAAAAMTPAAVASPTPPPAATGPAIGGAQLSGHGVLVNYPSGSVRRLPKIKASAWVIADAETGQVLAAKDPHGWYRPASTLKVLTAISLIPALNPNAMVVASKQATTVSPNIVGLLPGHPYKDGRVQLRDAARRWRRLRVQPPPALDRTALGGPPVLRRP
jgi:D-alanyl-D-alanine carboxypeptidase (penicillin-binding protein 5/6)